MESSRRDLLNDMAEHRSILKINENTHYPRFCFTPKTGIAFPKTGVLFLLCMGLDVLILDKVRRRSEAGRKSLLKLQKRLSIKAFKITLGC